MEALLKNQKAVGEDIERIVRNFRKDSRQRKAEMYLRERAEKLEERWNEFNRGHQDLEEFEEGHEDIDYFKSRYFEAIKAVVVKTQSEIQELLAEFHAESGKQDAGKSIAEGAINQTDGPSAITFTVRCENIMLETLRHSLERAEGRLSTNQPKEFVDAQLASLGKQWELIQTKHQQILESPCLPQDYDLQKYVDTQSWWEIVQGQLMGMLTQFGSMQANVKLPRIQLTKFDGNYILWQEFRDLFSQLIDQSNLGPAQKLWFLKTNLVGEAEALIRHLSVCDNNYQTAWKLVNERYDNKRLLVNSVLNKLMSQPNINGDHSQSIKTLHDVTAECVRALQGLEIAVDQWDPILVYILTKKLDKNTHILFEQQLQSPREIPTISQLLTFLELRFQSLEALGDKLSRFSSKVTTGKTTLTATKPLDVSCHLCKGGHTLNQCGTFLNLDVHGRRNCVTTGQLCFNCLKPGHTVKTCKSRSCIKCSRRHHTLLHSEKEKPKPTFTSQALTMNKHDDDNASYVFLGTAVVNLIDDNGQIRPARALIDSGSQLSFISEKLFKKLHVQGTQQTQEIRGIGNSRQQSKERVHLTLSSAVTEYKMQFEAFVLKEITSIHPERQVDISKWPIPSNILLADPRFYEPQEIELLLGAELFCSLISSGQIVLGTNLPTLQNTTLGWMVLGKVKEKPADPTFCGAVRSLDDQLQKFWELEEPMITSPVKLSHDDQECEAWFSATTTRSTTGRYIVRLPFAKSPALLGLSKQIALQRLNGLHRKFSRDSKLQEDYTHFMQEYIKLGHMELVENIDERKPHYYLPHHCVMRLDSTTTRLRVVFDGSAKTSSNYSLNDLLRIGPTLQQNLFNILVRFRYHKYVITADICKMYRQIQLHKDDRNFHLILWKEPSDERAKTYRLTTVTYGTRSAPYLAIRCLNQLAVDEKYAYPVAASTILRDFYVDDLLTGTDDIQKAINLQKQLSIILNKAGFSLHKWCSNNPNILKSIPSSDRATEFDITKLETENIVKTLGISWNPSTDEFSIKTSATRNSKPITKRIVLSEMSQLFDPLGIVNPVIVLAKIFMQQLWELKLDWDTPLPDDLQQKWRMYHSQLSLLNTLRIPRQIRSFNSNQSLQLHGFSDASERAYGVCIYLRSNSNNRHPKVFLVCAKSRVAPIKKRSIARLELCAAQLLVNLIHQVKCALNAPISQTFYWTDSTIVLQWIAAPASKFTTFVANRVSAIQTAQGDGIWQYIESSQNPADIVSRGILPSQLVGNKLWFEGPEVLRHPIVIQNVIPQAKDTIPEVKKTKFVLTATGISSNLISTIRHNNNFQRLQEVVAYILRFVANCRLPENERAKDKPNPTEMDLALKLIIREMQMQDFETEIKQLRKEDMVSHDSKIRPLSPIIDEEGIIRVGGRISKSKLPYKSKYTMLISHSNPISKLIFEQLHQKYLHAGPQTLLYISRQTFWCTNGRNLAKTVTRQCMRCARIKPQVMSQIMGDLPAERIQQSRPFLHVGIDFCGPVQIHFKLRGKRPVKAYIAVFVCFSTKATHLELTSDLTAAAFIGSLRRFIARRGRPAKIFSDNATNFIGARSELAELASVFYQQEGQNTITQFCCNENIEWLHIPPRSPHFGGLWEAAVKSAKYHMKRVIAGASLTYEELNTVICEIEAMLNSRPLTPMSSSPNDLQALSPGHFLIGQPLSTLADPAATMQNMSLTTRWKLVRSLRSEFWRRWSTEYLQELQNRYKWQKPQPDIKVGTLVLLKDDNLPTLQWRTGRVIDTIKGSDNHIRVAIVKTSNGEFRRAIRTLCLLPCNVDTPPNSSITKMSINARKPRIAPVTSSYSSLITSTKPKRKLEESAPQSSKKGKNTLLQMLLCVLLIPPLFNCRASASPVQVTTFENSPGIFFEEVDKVMLTHSTWKIVTYYDLAGYWAEYNGLTKCINSLIGACAAQQTLFNASQYCSTIITQFRQLQNEIQDRNALLYQHSIKPNRKKRAPLNIVGSAANFLFGILDEEFARKYEEDITKVKTNEKYLLSLIKNQTSIIDGTLNLFKKSTNEIHHQFKSIENQLELLETTVHNTEEVNQIFSSISIQTSLVLNHLLNIQTTLLQAVTNTYHGKISPSLLNVVQLQKQIQLMREHLPANKLVPVASNSPLSLYKIATVRTRTTTNNVIFDIRIPLLDSDPYQLLKIHPVPVKYRNTSIQIKPSTEYLAVTFRRDRYYPLSELERTKCHAFEMEYIICNQAHPIYTTQSDVNKCEVSLLIHQADIPAMCNIQMASSQNQWIQLETPNSWIFVTSNQLTLDVVCDHTIHHKMIEGSGILRLNPGCTLNHKAIILTGHSEISGGMNFSFVPVMNLSDFIPHFAKSQSTKINWNTNKSERNVQELEQELHHQLSADLPETISSHDIHNYSINYISLIMILIIGTYLFRKAWFIPQTHRNAHTNQQTSTTHNIDILSEEFKVAEDVQC